MKPTINKEAAHLHKLVPSRLQNSFSNKLLAVIFSAFLLLIAKNIYLSYEQEVNRSTEQISGNFSVIADILENDITRWLTIRKNETGVLSQNPLVKQYLSEIIKRDQNSAQAANELGLYWKAVIEQFGIYDEIYYANQSGQVLASSNSNRINTYRPVDSIISEPLKTGKIHFQDAYLSPTTKKPCIAFAIPVPAVKTGSGDNYDYAGVLVYRIDIDTVIKPLLKNGFNLGNTGEIILINRQKIAITELRTRPGSALNYELKSEPAEKVVQGEEGVFLGKGYNGKEMLSVYRFIPETRWGLIVRQETSEIFGSIKSQLYQSFATNTLAVALIFGLLYYLLRLVIKPVTSMAEVATAISTGDFSKKVTVRTSDEIGVLGRVINEMSDKLGCFFKIQKNEQDILKVLVSTLDMDLLLKKALETVCRSFDFKVGAVFLLDPEKSVLARKVSYCPGEQLMLKNEITLGEGFESLAAVTRKVQVLTDLPEDTYYTVNWLGGDIRPVSIVGVPLVFGSEVMGVMSLASFNKVDQHVAGELETIGTLIGVTINNVLSYQRAQDLTIRLQEVNEQLAQQNEELRAQSEELSVQAEELQSQTEELQSQAEELQSQTEQLQITTRELQEKNIKLEQLGEQKTKFFATLSHELKAPLNAVISFSDVLLDRVVGELNLQQEKYLHEIFNSGQHLLNLINDLLDLSRLEIGKIEPNIKEIDPSAPLEEVIAMVSAGASQKNLQLTNMVSSGLYKVYADPVRLKQIFLNLLTNAVKFTPQGGIVTIAAREDKNKIIFSVSDTGIGIPREYQESIFEEFKQAGNAVAGGYGGTGLGLAITKKLVELHGGRIYLESNEGKGTTFTFSLFRVASDDYLQKQRADCKIKCLSQESCSGCNCPRSNITYLPKPLFKSVMLEHLNSINCPCMDSTPTVLVIDDDPAVRNYVSEILKPRGYKVLTAENGREGIDLALKAKPDIIMLDISMPWMDGFGVMEELSKQCWGKGLSVCICTSKDISRKERDFLESRMKKVYLRG